jgi:hypothetical protein
MIKQRNDRDCLQCCLAELLNIDYDVIPKFYEAYPKDLNNCQPEESKKFTKLFDDWLNSLGFFRILFDVKYDDGNIKMPYISIKNLKMIGILKKENRMFSHCVILKNNRKTIEIDDPKKNSDYDIRDIIGIEILCKK